MILARKQPLKTLRTAARVTPHKDYAEPGCRVQKRTEVKSKMCLDSFPLTYFGLLAYMNRCELL